MTLYKNPQFREATNQLCSGPPGRSTTIDRPRQECSHSKQTHAYGRVRWVAKPGSGTHPQLVKYAREMTEVQARYRVVANGFDAAVRAVAPQQWEVQSPCKEWNARDVVAHVVAGHRGVIANVTGGESKPLDGEEDPKEAWASAFRAMDEITGEPEALAKEVDGPTGTMAAGEIIGRFVTMDVLVHTWDLARAVGAEERLDEDSVRMAYAALRPMDAMIRQPGVFGPKLDAPTGADVQTEFLYFLGRRA